MEKMEGEGNGPSKVRGSSSRVRERRTERHRRVAAAKINPVEIVLHGNVKEEEEDKDIPSFINANRGLCFDDFRCCDDDMID